MKQAKAPQAEVERLMRWLLAREGSADGPPPFRRVVFGYETLVSNCCDPTLDYLEFKPELLTAKEDKARLDSGMIRLGGGGENGACIHKEVNLREAIDRAIKYENGETTP